MKRLNEKPIGRWAINIDLEGFGHLYGNENLVLLSLCELMEGIFRIGTQYYPESPDRIFAHQLGDGFVIVSDHPEETFERPVAIALSLLRHVADSGRYAKATISDGEFADILSCYPSRSRDHDAFSSNGYRTHPRYFGSKKMSQRASVSCGRRKSETNS